ncbi:AIPR family protein [Finegoldia magna]|uniref:AIPR family protein n=1 Tax=Finegoldia magna TaxID=1260 RepID=UPI0029090748|nr:AIPR family protein [Finegoldia magna]MDU4731781.1 AIPR family protein [Finegoldia magna]
MAITKYESYYNQIKESLNEIKEINEYENLSKAFIHWYLKNHLFMDDQEIGECIIDGSGDNGIDAIILNEEEKELTVMQFKFPVTSKGINEEISQGDILKTINGFNILINKSSTSESNSQFKEYKNKISDIDIFKFNIQFISFNKGIEATANKELIDNFAKNFKKDFGSELNMKVHEKSTISNIYEKINRKNNLEINLSYKQLTSAYDIESMNIKSYVGLVNSKDLILSIEEYIETIFDENIRLYEGKTTVNNSIKSTASDPKESEMFYFYNNGITIICDKASNSPNKLSVSLKGVSIVNGCQTVTSIYELYKKSKLQSGVDILTRIIEISDYNERMKITEFLNSQNPIKDRYFIANHTIIRDLQKVLEDKGYYLERQVNEFEYKKMYGARDINDLTPIKLENVIQYYVGYWLDEYAALAKRGKSLLFDKNKIDEILMEINADRVIEAYNMYNKISKIITSYRRTRRNEKKREISDFLELSHEQFLENVDEYLFINTGDILILNTTRILKEKYEKDNTEFNDEKLIKDSIIKIHDKLISEFPDGIKNVSTLTKNTKIFKAIKDYVN